MCREVVSAQSFSAADRGLLALVTLANAGLCGGIAGAGGAVCSTCNLASTDGGKAKQVRQTLSAVVVAMPVPSEGGGIPVAAVSYRDTAA